VTPAFESAAFESDQASRERIRTSLDESLIVEAAAGTGKTTELVKRIVAVLAAGRTSIDRIAAVTFTHKAAGELKLKLREELDQARRRPEAEGDPAVRKALEEALGHLEEASIGTIHSFCAQVLRERPVEARVDPAFEELSEPEANRLYQRSFRAWLERSLDQPSPGLRRALARMAWSWNETPPTEQLQYAGLKLLEWRDYQASWRRQPFPREEEITTLVRLMEELAEASSHPRRVDDYLFRGLEPVRLLARAIRDADMAGPRDYDTLEARLLKLSRDLGRGNLRKGTGEYGGGVLREDLLKRREELLQWIEDFRQRADAELAFLLRAEMSGLVDEYQERKQRLGKLDFVDLLIGTRDLIRDQAHVRRYLQERFNRIFVDEFQDTDPVQAEILLLLAADDPAESDWLQVTPAPGKLFLVGDPKQSIYKFRRADIELYRQVRKGLAERGVRLLSLTRSFRSVPNIQHFVNAAFETEMDGDGHADWRPLERDRDEIPGRPSVIALPVPRPYKTRLAQESVNKSLPDAIAAFVAWLVTPVEEGGSGWRNEKGQAYTARDVAILFRRRTQGGTDLTREYARALEARNVAHLLAGSKSFHHREEVETLRAALAAIEWPDDELSVFAALKGSLFAIPDETLLVYRHQHGRLHPFHIAEGAAQPVVEALQILADLHRGRNRQPFAATVNALLESARAHAGFVLRPGGHQVLANVLRVADLARTYETTGGISFRGFVEELNTQAEKEEATEAPVLEEDSDGVRMMTVHGAKGLEFPIVVLADMTAKLASRQPDRYIDGETRLAATRLLGCAPWELIEHEPEEAQREQAEGVRVAYVAATRARDLLVLPAVGDEEYPQGGWLQPFYKALYPLPQSYRDSREAEGCPKFGASSVLERPLEYDHQPEFSVRPGAIVPRHGGHEVVWWDPSRLKLGEEGHFGLRQERILQDDGGASFAAYRSWNEQRQAAIDAASHPELDVFLASQASEAPPGDAIPVELVTARERDSASGRRFGVLVHGMLRDAALDAGEDAIRQMAELHARLTGAPASEVEAACQAVANALATTLLHRARKSKRCHREYPIRMKLESNRSLEGVIDLAFVEKNIWVIVDFKTDADVGEHRAQYERQLQWYAFALEQITGMPARAYLLAV
jgi:ATP-dependent helicase/nuclease subunit A